METLKEAREVWGVGVIHNSFIISVKLNRFQLNQY